MFNFRRIALALFLAVTSINMVAQDTSARLSGTVSDSSGAVVPGATLTLVNITTGAEVAHTVSDDHGNYTALQLPPGNYKLLVEAAGFRRTESPVQLFVASRIDLPITLQVGNVGETLVVTAQAEDLNRSDATVSTLISPNDVQNLPLPNREITNLIALAPGVVHGGASTNVNSAQLSINGSRTLNSETLLDGNSVVEGVTGQISRLPSPDMLGEFRIITSNAPAEYGRTSGGVVTMLTRSGNSSFHVGVYELFRNAVLNANTFANKLQTPVLKRPANNYNQFGVVLSGPVIVPKIYNGKERTFFYLNYDQTLQRNPSLQTQSVPS
ncbi:MAG TPA: carboxypeptidase regulatory-like domain-containing protein, partial [Edaphobacter sp.]